LDKENEEGEEKCQSLAAWDMVCKPKDNGGLGILNLKLQNQGLLLKYLHKFYNKVDIPWVHLLWNTYYLGRIPHSMEPIGSFWWKDVCKLMPIFRGFASSSVGDGLSTLFWKDDWLLGVNAENFPRAYSFASNEDVSVQSFLTAGRLSSNFWLPLSPQAFEEVKDLQSLVADVNISSISDSWAYPWGKEYTSSKFYKYCFHNIHPHKSFVWLWKSKCTPELNSLAGLCSEGDTTLSTPDTSA
jgi:hypothetical protein